VESAPLLDCVGRRRSPATLPGYHQGRPPRNKGLRSPPDPPTVQEIVAVMRAAGNDHDGVRLRGVMVVLWRAGLRISEALALAESDLDPGRGAVLVRAGKEASVERSGWTAGPGSSSHHGSRSSNPAGRCAVLCSARPDPRTAVRAGAALVARATSAIRTSQSSAVRRVLALEEVRPGGGQVVAWDHDLGERLRQHPAAPGSAPSAPPGSAHPPARGASSLPGRSNAGRSSCPHLAARMPRRPRRSRRATRWRSGCRGPLFAWQHRADLGAQLGNERRPKRLRAQSRAEVRRRRRPSGAWSVGGVDGHGLMPTERSPRRRFSSCIVRSGRATWGDRT